MEKKPVYTVEEFVEREYCIKSDEIPDINIVMPEANTLTKGDVDLGIFDTLGHVTTYQNLSPEELTDVLEDADVVMVNKNILNEKTLSKAKRLKYIGECATGFNNIDLDYCNAHGITVTNVPTYSTNAVAQQVFAFILNHYSRVSQYNDFVQKDGWKNADTFAPFVFDTDELFGKTIGLVGYGKIGRAVAKIANAFGMNVLVYTRSYQKSVDAATDKWGNIDRTRLDGFLDRTDDTITYRTLDNLLKHSDIVSIHCPLNEESMGLFSHETFAKMRTGAYLVNTARGPIVDEEALIEALNTGKLSGAGLDVLEKEPQSKDSKLLGVPNLTITPHVAWAPLETRRRLVSEVAKNLEAFEHGHPRNVVNNP